MTLVICAVSGGGLADFVKELLKASGLARHQKLAAVLRSIAPDVRNAARHPDAPAWSEVELVIAHFETELTSDHINPFIFTVVNVARRSRDRGSRVLHREWVSDFCEEWE